MIVNVMYKDGTRPMETIHNVVRIDSFKPWVYFVLADRPPISYRIADINFTAT